MTILLFCIFFLLGLFFFLKSCIDKTITEEEIKKQSLMTPEEKEKYLEEIKQRQQEIKNWQLKEQLEAAYGNINAAMFCSHCQTKGHIRTKEIKQKKGVSGGKATAAVLTGGLSLLAVGLSRKEATTQAHCDNCNNNWYF